MRETDEFRGRQAAVIGAARAGAAAARALAAAGAYVTLYDPKPIGSLGDEARELAADGFRLEVGRSDYQGMETAEIVVPSPGVRHDAQALREARARGAEILGEIELAYRLAEAPIIAITGTNGKSTTTAMCGAMLEGAYRRVWTGGNLAPGEPLASLAVRAHAGEIIVAEVSSFQLEQISTFRPWAAVLTNLTPDHLDRHRDLSEYASAKARIFENQVSTDFAIVHAACAGLPELGLSRTLRTRPFLYAIDEPESDRRAWLDGDWLTVSYEGRRERLTRLSAIPVPGWHNVENALAAALAAWLVGARPDGIERGLAGFRPVAHRLEDVATVEGVRYVNNSMCTNPAALVASLHSFEEPVILISGGKNKNLDFIEAGRQIARRAKSVVLIGSAADEMAAAIGSSGPPVSRAKTLSDALDRARDVAVPGDVVMLAPGCASLDMFNDFMDRGEQFVKLVNDFASGSRLPIPSRTGGTWKRDMEAGTTDE